jgi:tetratricopeptide (TPR) repeat protein
MRFRALAIALILLFPAPAYPNDDVTIWLAQTIEELRVQLYKGDMSSAQRRLAAILDEDPTNLEALWQLTYTQHLSGVKNWSLLDRSANLSKAGPKFEYIIRLARKQGNLAFGHLVKAWQAWLYNAFPQALDEIDQALHLDPNSTRYLMIKGRILKAKGTWEGEAETIGKAVVLLKHAHRQSQTYPTPFYKGENFFFYLGRTVEATGQDGWAEAIQHYQKAIELGKPGSRIQTYSWNNMSILYRKLGQCQKAKEAAEEALAITKFSAAKRNKQYAEFCLEIEEQEDSRALIKTNHKP